MDDERIRLILELGGEAAVKSMGQEVNRLEQEIKGMVVAWQGGALSTEDFLKSSGKLNGDLKKSKDAFNELKGTGSRGGGNSGQGILGASYAVQDFVSVLSGGQGLGRAIGRDHEQRRSGAHGVRDDGWPGRGGATSGCRLLGVTPLIESMFSGISGPDADKAKKTLEEIKEKVVKLHDEYVALKQGSIPGANSGRGRGSGLPDRKRGQGSAARGVRACDTARH